MFGRKRKEPMTVIGRWPYNDNGVTRWIGVAIVLDEWPQGVPSGLMGDLESPIEASWTDRPALRSPKPTDGRMPKKRDLLPLDGEQRVLARMRFKSGERAEHPAGECTWCDELRRLELASIEADR